MISPQMFFDISVEESVDTGYDEWQNEDSVAIDPDVVGEIVLISPVYLLKYGGHVFIDVYYCRYDIMCPNLWNICYI